MKRIGVIGPSKMKCSSELYSFGIQLGELISEYGHYIICGGLDGFMEAVCKGAKHSLKTFKGQTVGILPSDQSESSNPFVDIPIATGLGFARNIIIINSSDILISAGGGAGTLSELAFAWQKKKEVLCITSFGGWSKELAGKPLDNTSRTPFKEIVSIDEIEGYL